MKRYAIQTFGCQMNVHDAQRIEEMLRTAGYEATDEPTLADLVVVNTCSVREKAEHKLMSYLGTLRGLKSARRGVLLAVAGCVAQQEGEQLLKKARFIDLVFGPDNIPELPDLLLQLEAGAPPIVRTVFDTERPSFLMARPSASRAEVSSYVTVMKGCDERCTFCIVPYTRGPERYRPADEIVEEIRQLVHAGVREVTLLGQTVNSWYEPSSAGVARSSEFPSLLRRIASEVPGLVRLRYTSPHPRHVTEELVRAHADLDVLAAHVHLPVQSGSNRVLKRMLRRYTREEYLDRVHALQACRTGLTVSSDFIVGFPGETEEDFALTLSLVREARLIAAFAFKYSPRPYTPALKLGDDVPEDVKDARLARLFETLEKQQTAHLQSLQGTIQRVLVTGASASGNGRHVGRTERNEIVHVGSNGASDPTGQLVSVRIERVNRHSLLGALVGVHDAGYAALSEKLAPRVRLPILPGAPSTATV